jgi:serine/threonine-protein kinase
MPGPLNAQRPGLGGKEPKIAMTAHGRAQFLEGLSRCEALNGEQLREMQHLAHTVSAEPRFLGQELLRRGWMTAYQINQINRGQADHLRLGPYVVLERLGHGSMGEVFKARHVRMGRLAAVKVIRSDRRERPRAFSRFEREVQSVGRFDHPNIVHAYDAEICEDGTFFLAMEYLEGQDLKRLVLEHGPLSLRQASDCARQAALGLQHAFERQVIHRDVKPSNLFLVTRGQVVKLLDMGLSRLRDEVSDLTRPHIALGTVEYEAPEQLADARTADVRSDLYGLGCTLYFLLTGRPPFAKGAGAQRLLAHVMSEAQPVELLRPEVPAALADVVRKLMAKDPDRRYQVPVELAQDLAELLASQALPDDNSHLGGASDTGEGPSRGGSSTSP